MPDDPGEARERAPFHRRVRRGVLDGTLATGDALLLLLLTFAALAVLAPVVASLLILTLAVLDPATPLAEREASARTYLLLLAAVLGAPFVLWRALVLQRQADAAGRQAETAEANRALTEARNLTDRFVKAVEMLGARQDGRPVLEQRLGAIYALEALARESRAHHIQIMEVLCAYIREHSPASKARESPAAVLDRLTEANPKITDAAIAADPAFTAAMEGCDFSLDDLRGDRGECLHQWAATLRPPPEDIRAALDVIGRRGAEQQSWETDADYRLDLRATCLQAIAPQRPAYAGARLSGARLDAAILGGAYLEGAQLVGAQLMAAVLDDADLSRARLNRANLEGAKLNRANLAHAMCDFADLRGAWLEEANLGRAMLGGVALEGACLKDADLEGAFIGGGLDAPILLKSTNLRGTACAGSAWRSVDFSGANLDEKTNLRNAFFDGSVVGTGYLYYLNNTPVIFRDDTPSLKNFFARWRGWIERGGRSWDSVASGPWRDVEPIPPPEGLAWATDDA